MEPHPEASRTAIILRWKAGCFVRLLEGRGAGKDWARALREGSPRAVFRVPVVPAESRVRTVVS